MNIKRIRKEIAVWTSSGKRITQKRLLVLDADFANDCISLAQVENRALSEIVWWKIYGRPECPVCNNYRKYIGSHQQGFNAFCSSKCAGAFEEVKDKRKSTNMDRYGVTSPSKVESIRAKQRKSMMQRYGVEYGGQSQDLLARAKATTIERYGVEAPLKCPELLEKARATWTRHYGVDHPMKNREYFESQQKKGFSIRKIRIKGKIFRVRGFEGYAIKYLVKLGFEPDNILTTAKEGVPSIPYYDRKSKTNRVYHPDMLVRREDREYIVEVKSSYTAGIMKGKKGHHAGEFYRVRAKARACVDAGWKFKLLIATKNKQNKDVVVISNLHEKTLRQVRDEFKTKARGIMMSDI